MESKHDLQHRNMYWYILIEYPYWRILNIDWLLLCFLWYLLWCNLMVVVVFLSNQVCQSWNPPSTDLNLLTSILLTHFSNFCCCFLSAKLSFLGFYPHGMAFKSRATGLPSRPKCYIQNPAPIYKDEEREEEKMMTMLFIWQPIYRRL